jgi:cell division septum initiation protein DivIVA
VDVHDKLDELTEIVENARAMPMSASCIINRAEVLGLLEELRELLPEEFRHAQMLITDRQAVIDEGRREADRIVDEGLVERAKLVEETDIVAEAHRRGEEIRTGAQAEAATMRREVDDYVDTKLANFEVVLDKTLRAVSRGRDKLRGRSPHEDLAEDPGALRHPLDDDLRRA